MGFYNRYFKDYTEEKVLGRDGREHIERTYRGFYYVPDLSRAKRGLRAAIYMFLYVGAACLFILSGSLNLSCNSCWPVGLTMGVSLFCQLIALIPTFSCVLYGTRQTEYQYTSGSKKCVKWNRITAAAMGLTALSALIASLIFGESLTAAGGYVLSAGMIAAIAALERRVSYHTAHNPQG